MLLVPGLFLLLLEAALKLGGFGYATSFLLPSTVAGKTVLIQNNHFGWRFFGPQMARNPADFAIEQPKPPGTVRIFVFGESAAFGDPQPEFGLPRMLQTLLHARYPATRFEVVNTAMVGINSHVVLPIARDCARADGDIWVIYMGNNEVVGPFGSGTVFGSQSPPLPVIRTSLALKATRLGELMDAGLQHLHPPPPSRSEWGGMRMFLDQQVRADDSRMPNVYHHFEKNLADIIQLGQRSGAGIVVSTVAVNLKDSAPFASQHRIGLAETDESKWKDFFQRGVMAQSSGDNQTAAEQFVEAARVDDSFAELRFRQAQCALALGDVAGAQKQFAAARDLDALRFRCDDRLNELIRAAANHEGDRILLADSERVFAEQSESGLPGRNYFYEHVHLNFSGNYLLARTLAAQVEKLLPPAVVASAGVKQPWPDESECAQRLAWTDWNRQTVYSEIMSRLESPPFTGQINHDTQMQEWQSALAKLGAANQSERLQLAQKSYEAALASNPDDAVLRSGLATLELAVNNFADAETNAQRAVELLPGSAENWSLLGGVFAAQQKFEAAAAAYQKAFQLDPQRVWSLHHEAQALAKLGRRAEAERDYRRAVALKPMFGLSWLALGLLLEEDGRKDEAQNCFQKALANPIRGGAALTTLAKFCQERGWFDAAVTNYRAAIQTSSPDPMLHLAIGQCYAALKNRAEAVEHFTEATRLSPGLVPAHFLLGLELLRAGRLPEGETEFRTVIRLAPDSVEAHLNLALALMNENRNAEAAAELEEVLRRDSANRLALEKIQTLRGQPPR